MGGGGWVGQIKIKDHLSPAEAEVGAELGKIKICSRDLRGTPTRIKFDKCALQLKKILSG